MRNLFPFRYRGPHQRFTGSAGVVGAMAGAFAAGKIMIWCGLFKPGITASLDIIDYWPGFLTGAAVGGFALSLIARVIWNRIHEDGED